jgi:hypothetical protein
LANLFLMSPICFSKLVSLISSNFFCNSSTDKFAYYCNENTNRCSAICTCLF